MRMPALSDLRDQACIVGIGETDYTRGTPKSALELDEGPRLTTWVTGVAPDKLQVGMPVEVWFDTVSDDVTLPKFKPQLPL